MATPSDTEYATQAEPNRRRQLINRWIAATIGGLASAPILGYILAMGLYAAGIGTGGGGLIALMLGLPLGVVPAGIVIAVAQAAVLAYMDTPTGWTRHAGWRWAVATACGWIVGLVGGYMAFSVIGRLVPQRWDSAPVVLAVTLIGLATTGALLGLAQWLVLRTHVAHAGRWVAASAAGTAGGGLLIIAILQMLTGYPTPTLGNSLAVL